MAENLLNVQNLRVSVGDKEILHGIDLKVNKGETHVLMGPNGAGKSTLGFALMGNPLYKITSGSILFGGKEINSQPADERAKQGIFLSFQNPLEVPGITLKGFIRSTLQQRGGKRVPLWEFNKQFEYAAGLLQMDPSYGNRDLNVGFSGGEKKKAEILQMLMLHPALAILDETDSGLDVDAVRTVSQGVREYQKSKNGGLIIITHSTRILESLKVDYTHVLVGGKIVKTGDGSLVEEINKNGFEAFESAAD